MRRKILPLLLAACLLLPGCRRDEPVQPEPPQPPAAVQPAPEEPLPEESRSIALERLAVEVVVDWEDADRILDSLEDLSRLLEDALGALDCTVEEPVAVTIGTAGGVTAQALGDGGVDAAFLPEGDLAELGGKAVGVLADPDSGLVAAVSGKRGELDGAFRAVLARALTETEDGRTFLETCYPGAAFAPWEERPVS